MIGAAGGAIGPNEAVIPDVRLQIFRFYDCRGIVEVFVSIYKAGLMPQEPKDHVPQSPGRAFHRKESAFADRTGVVDGDLAASVVVDGLAQPVSGQALDPHSVALLSHDLRAPLTGLLGYLELLEESGLSERQAGLLAHAAESANGLLAMINDVLDVSRLEAGRMPLARDPFSLRESFGQLMAQMAPLAFRKHLRLSMVVEADVPDALLGDPCRIGQLVTNLISNSIKFTRQGEVQLRVSVLRQRGTALRLGIEVSDTGIGIDPSRGSTFFEPFVQGEAALSEGMGGSGLGLEICRRLVAMMQGCISLRSAPGQGSCFLAEIELSLANAIADAPAMPSLNGCTVLLAVDNDGLRDELRELVRWAGGRAIELKPNAAGAERLLAEAPIGQHVLVIDADASGVLSPEHGELCQQATALGHRSLVVVPSLQTMVLQTLARRTGADVVSSRARPGQLLGKLRCGNVQPASGQGPMVSGDQQAHAPVAQDLSGLRVLLVDDDELVTGFLTAVLVKHQAKVRSVGSLGECRDAMSEACFDVILMDLNLPDGGGCEAVSGLRARQSRERPLHIIGLSGERAAEAGPRALEAGMDEYLEKPVTANELLACLARTFRKFA